MFIDDIDLADLYRKRLQLVERIEKKPEHWGKRTEKMAENYTSLADSYLLQLSGRIDLKGAESLSDMGYGPGTISLALTRKTPIVYGTDYSQGILSVATRRAAQTSARHV